MLPARMCVWWKPEFDENGPERAPSWEARTRSLGILMPPRDVDIDDVEIAAEAYADYFHSHRDGYENTWPCEFVVLDRRDQCYFVVAVDREFDPVFRASKPTEIRVSSTRLEGV